MWRRPPGAISLLPHAIGQAAAASGLSGIDRSPPTLTPVYSGARTNASPLPQEISQHARVGWRGITAIGIFAFLSCYLQRFIFACTPVLPWGDGIMWLESGAHILRGEMPYRDYFQLTTPGTDALYALLLRLCGSRAWMPDLLTAVILSLAAVLTALIAKHVLRKWTALVPSLLLIGLVFPISEDPTHHWFSTLAALGAVLALVEGTSTRRVLVCGILTGVAAFFTQTTGLALFCAFSIFFLAENRLQQSGRISWRRFAIFCGTTVATFVPLMAYFFFKMGLRSVFFWTVVFPIRYFRSEGPFNTWKAFALGFDPRLGPARLLCLIFVHIIPVVYLLIAYRFRFWQREEDSRRPLLLIGCAGLALVGSIAAAASPLRLACVSPFAVILLVVLLQSCSIPRVAVSAASAIALIWAIGIPARAQRRPMLLLDTPSGRIAIQGNARFEEFRWVGEHTKPGQSFWELAPICFAFGLRNPTPLNFSTPNDFTRPSEVAGLVEGIDKTRAPVLVLLRGTSLEPLSPDKGDHMGPFRKYLRENYRLARVFSTGDEAWIRSGTNGRPDSHEPGSKEGRSDTRVR